jgi:putative polyhydroxyalkanoate system protein
MLAMSRPISVNIPHSLGKDEAKRRIDESFGNLQTQMSGGMLGLMSFNRQWEGDRLSFSGGGLGQKITGRLDILPDAVQVQVDLPELLAAIADKITGRLQQETKKLLEKK